MTTHLKRAAAWILYLYLLVFIAPIFGDEQQATHGTITFTGQIDGSDHIHFKGKTAWYVHGSYQAPTQMNTMGDTVNPPLPTCGNITVSLSDIVYGQDENGSGSVSIEQQPSTENENEIIVLVDDDTPWGSHPMSFTLTWTVEKCNSGGCSAGNGGVGSSSSANGTAGSAGINLGDGQLALDAAVPNASLATPAGLAAFVGSDSIVIRDTNNAVSQVVDSTVAADIQVVNSQKYTVKLYYRSQASASPSESGVYTFTGEPYSVWTIENPGNASDPLTALRITKQEGSQSKETEFSWPNGDNGTIVTKTGNGSRCETRSVSYDVDKASYLLGSGNRTETISVTNASASLIYKESNVYHKYPWGEEKIRKIVDPDGAALTNQWSYGEEGSTTGYAHVIQIIQPNGYWERYEYDDSGRQTKIVAQYLDASIGANENLSRVTSIAYEKTDYTDGWGNGNTTEKQTKVEKLLDQEVARNYSVNYITWHNGRAISDITEEIQCQTAGAAMDNPMNLKTTTEKISGGDFSGYPKSIKKPDGTLSLYSYSADGVTKTTTVLTGQPSSDALNVVNGTQAVTVTDLKGNIQSQTTTDIASGLITASSVTQSVDAFGRPIVVAQLSGTTVSSYGCCGLESQTDQEGITTSYVYDSLQRVIASTRAGVTTLTTYDPQGNILSTSRAAVNSPTVLTGTSTYDLAGRRISSGDALGNTTTYSETLAANGELVKTTTYPDGSTRVETYFMDGQLKELSGKAVHPIRYNYGADSDGKWTKEIHVAADGSENEWVKTWYDMAGRAWKTLSSGGAVIYSYYNSKGQLWKAVDADNVATLYQYNAKGELEYTATDMNRNDTVDFDGTDRVTRVQNEVVTAHGTVVNCTTSTAYGTPNAVSLNETSVDGLQSWSTVNGLITSNVIVRDGQGGRTVTITAPDGTVTTQSYQNGLLLSSTAQNPSVGTLASAALTYDAYGRQSTSTDAQGIVTTWSYNDGDQMTSTTVTGGALSQTITSTLNYKGQPIQTTRPEGTVTYAYQPTGEVTDISGGWNYPAHYTYDSQGRMKTLTTWQDYSGKTGASVTTWNYDAASGLLTSKIYDGGQGTSYTYTSAGRLASRRWERGITTTYGYDNGGTLSSTQYSDSTPAITITRNSRGQITSVSQGATAVGMAWTVSGQLTSESWNGGPLDGITITGSYDSLQRLSGIGCPVIGYTSNLTYDAASRFAAISSGSARVQYGYLPNSSLVQTMAFGKGGAPVMTTTKSYDGLNRLSGINSSISGTVPSAHTYSYNEASQRTGATLADGSYWVYQYDSLGQVTSGKKYLAGGIEFGGEQYGYAFDNIGNRTSTSLNSRSAAYTVNGKNQYMQREVPGAIDVIGTGGTGANIAVNGQEASRQGESFYKALTVSNTNGAVFQSLSVIAAMAGSGTNGTDIMAKQTGHVYVPQTPEQYSYDLDGNLTSDGRWTYSWDGENRLTAMETNTAAVTAGAPKEKIEFAYDWQGRRIQKTVSLWNATAGAYQVSKQMKYAYWGWNLIAELSGSASAIRSYGWGPDLSGNLTGAGGVGGLVAVTDGSSGVSYAPAYDGNGNITALVSMDDGSIAASYEYGPFGEPLRVSGAMAAQNPFRFSTKYTDDETGLVYYGYRYYNPSTGRWINRDPIEENGGVNLYGMVYNSPVNWVDFLGLVIDKTKWFSGPVTLEVEKCEILIYYGHHTRYWQPVKITTPNKCSAAGAITCSPGDVNSGISYPLPNLQYHNDPVTFVDNGKGGEFGQNMIDRNNEAGRLKNDDPTYDTDAMKMLQQARADAVTQANKLLKKNGGCCDKVKITEYKNGNGPGPNPVKIIQ